MTLFVSFLLGLGVCMLCVSAQSPGHSIKTSRQCDWNPAGPLHLSLHQKTCFLSYDPEKNLGSSELSAWTHRPVCTSPKTNSRYCAFVKDDFHGDSAVLVLTSPETAAGDLGLIEDSDPRWLSPGSSSLPPRIPPYEVRKVPGKELGVVANSTIRAGEVIMRDYPTILQTVSTEVWEQIDPREALWVLEEGFVRLPEEVQIKVFELARSTGGHVLEDVLHTNTFAASFNNVSHYGLFTNIARINHDCRPNAVTRYSPRTLALEVVAYRDIQPGEELSISYSPLNMLYADRQRTLQEWGFNCTCSLCSSASAVAASDARRGRMQEIVSALNNKVFRSLPARMAELAEELDGILKEEGLSAQKGDFYDILARAYVDMGEVETGRRYARLAVEKLVHFAGYDDERTERARGLLGELGKVGGA
uniref:SET domain-containing protein n=1 Tax=Colletotrichum fructicola (strain Nara gc5) TaxID=1213859 RepID=L2FM87_COLFN